MGGGKDAYVYNVSLCVLVSGSFTSTQKKYNKKIVKHSDKSGETF